MIVDTSALMAIALREPAYERMLSAILEQDGRVPAPALVEFRRVIGRKGPTVRRDGEALLQELCAAALEVEPFGPEDAHIAGEANSEFGIGNQRGGTLNLLDLMVYAVAKRSGRPVLCTGRDFAATGIAIHPASRQY
jgi:ribonuclease VapC